MPIDSPLSMPRRASGGFSLIELLVAVAIIGILAATATAIYRDYLMRAQLAQQLLDADHIRTVVMLETQLGRGQLERGALAGAVPPALTNQLSASEFNGPDGLRMQLVRWPASRSSVPGGSNVDQYALAVDVQGPEGGHRLAMLLREIDRAGFRHSWLSGQAFLFALGDAERRQPVGSGTNPGNTPGAVIVPTVAPASAASAATTASAPASTPRPVTTTTTAPSTQGACPPGWTPVGRSGACTPPHAQACPPGWTAVGHSGHCRHQ
jgi:prepilin-type N-terminal cleavage/methylation domain-containing protein